jgi:LmbE family N-acetylglucosaminyl deacetylase
MSDRVLMAVFAHPDDEAFGTGGTFARYATEGVDVHLVTATRGEAGQIAEGVAANAANLPDIREQELRCACRAYGIRELHLLGYTDGQLTIAHQGQAVGRLVRLIREVRPQVIVTFGPEGIYGHYDHIAVHRWTTIAVELANDPDCFPNTPGMEGADCRPHEVAKVYFRVMPEAQLDVMRNETGRAAVMMDGVPFPFVGYPEDQITTVLDVSDYIDRKIRGIRCHATQIPAGSADEWEEMMQSPAFRLESYRLARSTVGWPEDREDDLFARL